MDSVHMMTGVGNGVVKTKCGRKVDHKLPKTGETGPWTGFVTRVTCGSCLSAIDPTGLHTQSIIRGKVTPPESPGNKKEEDIKEMAKTLEFDADVVATLVRLRDDEGKKWTEISDETGIPVGKAMFIHSSSKVSKKDRVKDATPEAVKNLRDGEGLSWGDIMVRCGLPEGAVRRLYRDAGGEDKGNRIGKGGRYPGGASPEGGTKEPKAKKEKAAPVAHNQFEDMEADAITKKVTGFAIRVDKGNGDIETIKVKAVKKVNLEKGVIVLTDGETGAARTLKLASIAQVSKKKVL